MGHAELARKKQLEVEKHKQVARISFCQIRRTLESDKMGNPAGMRLKAREKRRAKFEKRLGGPLAYVPKEIRETVLQQEAAFLKAEADAKKKAAAPK